MTRGLCAGPERYWEWVAAGRRYAVAQDLLRMAQARNAQLIARVESGDLANFEHVDNQRAVVQREGQVVAAERLLQQSAMDLSHFIRDGEGLPVLLQPAWLPTSFPIPVAAEEAVGPLAIEDVLERRPDVQCLELTRQQQSWSTGWLATSAPPPWT